MKRLNPLYQEPKPPPVLSRGDRVAVERGAWAGEIGTVKQVVGESVTLTLHSFIKVHVALDAVRRLP